MSHIRRTLLPLLAGGSLLLASVASATIMVELPLDEMIRDAEVIVHGTVVRSGVRLEIGDGSMEPQTNTTIRVQEWLAGSGGETVRLRERGGEWQGQGVRFDGTPEYAVGEEVVVFLERRAEAPHDLRTLGMVQGKFNVRHGVPGVPSVVLRDLRGISFAHWTDGRQTIDHPGHDPVMGLESFLDHVRARVSTRGLSTRGLSTRGRRGLSSGAGQ